MIQTLFLCTLWLDSTLAARPALYLDEVRLDKVRKCCQLLFDGGSNVNAQGHLHLNSSSHQCIPGIFDEQRVRDALQSLDSCLNMVPTLSSKANAKQSKQINNNSVPTPSRAGKLRYVRYYSTDPT